MGRELTQDELFDRSLATLVHSFRCLAAGSAGAEVIETDGAVIAIFIRSPDREFLNNAILIRGVGDPDSALAEIERVYERHGIERYAVWVHDSEDAVGREVEARGYRYDSSTRAMAMAADELTGIDTSMLDLVEPTLERFWAVDGTDCIAPDLDTDRARLYISRFGGEDAATLMAFDYDGDCGIYMVGTRPAARRRGLATALSAHAVKQARERGCTTVSLQSTEMAEGVYSKVGFRDLGRFVEYTPSQPSKEKT